MYFGNGNCSIDTSKGCVKIMSEIKEIMNGMGNIYEKIITIVKQESIEINKCGNPGYSFGGVIIAPICG